MRDNLNKNDQDFIAGIHHKRKKVEYNSIADIFLAGIKRMAEPPRILRERRATPTNPDQPRPTPTAIRKSPIRPELTLSQARRATIGS